MATEEGIVTRIGVNTAWVKVTKSGSCKACSARGSCNVSVDGTEMKVEAVNAVGARVGDRIILSFETSSLLKATFLLYVFPILCMIAGAIVGKNLSSFFNLSESLLEGVFGFAFFFLAVILVKSKGNKLAKRDKYRPKIIKVIKHH